MKKSIVLVLIISILGFSFYGCTNNDEQPNNTDTDIGEDQSVTEKVELFYGDENNEKMVSEEREITYEKDEDKYQVVVEELIKGPSDESLTANINPDTEVIEITNENADIIIDLSSEFNEFSGSIAEIIGIGSLVNTITQFEGTERVKILIEGEELIGPSGKSRGFMETFPLDPQQETTKEVVLYFGGQNAEYVVPEKRNISVSDDISQQDYIKYIVEELIKGPSSEDLNATIPPETEVLSVKVEDSIAYIDFSEEMHTKHWGGAAGEAMTISSIANTLTELDYIDKVNITVNGEPLAIEHTILEKPVGRNEDMIQK